MKVICVNNTIGNSRNFKIGQLLEKKDLTDKEKMNIRLPDDYVVIKDIDIFNNQKTDVWCPEQCFITLEEWREKQLDKLL